MRRHLATNPEGLRITVRLRDYGNYDYGAITVTAYYFLIFSFTEAGDAQPCKAQPTPHDLARAHHRRNPVKSAATGAMPAVRPYALLKALALGGLGRENARGT